MTAQASKYDAADLRAMVADRAHAAWLIGDDTHRRLG